MAPATRRPARRVCAGPIPGTHLWPGDVYTVPGTDVRVAGLPGNFAPNWYGQPKPFPGDRVRHFNEAEVRALEALPPPAVLLLHEAFRGQAPGRLGMMGVPALSALVRRLRPAVCLTGHHHLFDATQHGPTLALALPLASAGYVRLRFSPAGDLLRWELVDLCLVPPCPPRGRFSSGVQTPAGAAPMEHQEGPLRTSGAPRALRVEPHDRGALLAVVYSRARPGGRQSTHAP